MSLYRTFVGKPLEIVLTARARAFLPTLQHARAVSDRTLQHILATNGATAWGRRWGLHGTDPLAAFRAMPLTTYADYAPYIERVRSGEPDVLTRESPVYFACIRGPEWAGPPGPGGPGGGALPRRAFMSSTLYDSSSRVWNLLTVRRSGFRPAHRPQSAALVFNHGSR
jgi:hypothetical protein